MTTKSLVFSFFSVRCKNEQIENAQKERMHLILKRQTMNILNIKMKRSNDELRQTKNCESLE